MLLAAALLSIFGAVELRWESAAGCPDAAAVDRDLRALLGERPRGDAAEVTGRLVAGQGAHAHVLHLEVVLAGRREARVLRANDCTVLTRAGVLVAAVTVDALAAAAAVDARPAAAADDVPVAVPEPAAVSPDASAVGGARAAVGPSSVEVPSGPADARADELSPRSTPPAEPPPSALRSQPRRRGATLAASAGIAQGMTPGVAGGVAGALGWRRGALRLVAGGFHWFSRRAELRPEVGIESALSGAALRGCVAFARARLEVPLCAGLDLAAMHGGGVGAMVQRRDVRDLWIGVAAGTGLSFWPTRRFALQAQVEGVLGARRPAMYLLIGGEPQEAFRMPPVGLRLWVGPVLALW